MNLLKRLLILTVLLWFAPSASASGDFTTDFHSIYQIGESDSVQVEHIISLTNNTSHLYTTTYILSVGSSQISRVQATSGTVPLPTSLSTLGKVTTITITLVDPVIGQDKVNSIHLSYLSNDIATRVGKNLEINIPRVSRANEFREYTRDVVVPSSYGDASYLFPEPTHIEGKSTTTYSYTGFAGDSLSLFFGKSQSYHLSLAYTISNPSLTKSKTEIALPPPTAYQDIILEQITPVPEQIRLDADGNWLAEYTLKAHESLEIQASLYATVYPIATGKSSPPPSSTLGADLNWPTGDKAVKTLARELGSVPHIYNYLLENFSYDYTRLGQARLGAAKALESPSEATCTEFTDVFVALTRSLGIPARELNGYAYESQELHKPQGEDSLHAWPEYFDEREGVWRQLDPTWGNTTGGLNYFDKLDYGHITFVIHGTESTYPLPAGAYEHNGRTPSVKVTPVDQLPEGLVPSPLTPHLTASPPPSTTLWHRLLAFLRTLL